jgi:hypothetical protein
MSPAVTTILTGVGGTLLAALLIAVIRMLYRVSHQIAEQRADWYGEAARPGYDRRPGIPERLQKIEAQLKPNGGASARDAITRVENAQQTMMVQYGELLRQVGDVKRALDNHVRDARELPGPKIIEGDQR